MLTKIIDVCYVFFSILELVLYNKYIFIQIEHTLPQGNCTGSDSVMYFEEWLHTHV